MTSRQAVIYYSDSGGKAVQREVAMLRAELDVLYDIVVAGYCRTQDALNDISDVEALPYLYADLAAMAYPQKLSRFTPDSYLGFADLVPMKFFQERPDFDYYWVIENDVRYSGRWATLFRELGSSDADLLCTTVQAPIDNPHWAHWNSLGTGDHEIPMDRRLKGFIPFGRISRRLLEACDACYRAGYSGHSEVLWPTIAAERGFVVEDIGGLGRFTPIARRGRFYHNTPDHWSLFPGSFVYRPCFLDRELSGPGSRFPDLLWHPVKA
ncbi:MAG TPA: hypothetical protein VF511_02150 [Chthoniobacterales bacterium]|jgi:hypothetical protein